MRCLKNEKHCVIKCKKLIDEYIDCIDKTRIDIIKQRIAEEERCQLLEERDRLAKQQEELTKSFLKLPINT